MNSLIPFDTAKRTAKPGQLIEQMTVGHMARLVDAMPGNFLNPVYRKEWSGDVRRIR